LDCGGDCSPCAPFAGCFVDADCKGGLCVANTCAPTCSDGVKNESEGDVDCGGPSCAKCADGKTCSAASDCASNVCAGTCKAATCSDKLKSGAETDVDCGGPTCPACVNGKACIFSEDCASGACDVGKCGPWVRAFGSPWIYSNVDFAVASD